MPNDPTSARLSENLLYKFTRFYREKKSGDFLVVWPNTQGWYEQYGQFGVVEARSTCIEGDMRSVCTCSVSLDFLWKKCNRIARAIVPKDWLYWLVGDDDDDTD